ncbi:MAG: hypothetical protein ACK5N9_05840 [Pirellula sp.]|jgi:hypothetical protein
MSRPKFQLLCLVRKLTAVGYSKEPTFSKQAKRRLFSYFPAISRVATTLERLVSRPRLSPKQPLSTLHDLLSFFEGTEEFLIAFQENENDLVDLKEISDGLAGELVTEEGWISRRHHSGPLMHPPRSSCSMARAIAPFSELVLPLRRV